MTAPIVQGKTLACGICVKQIGTDNPTIIPQSYLPKRVFPQVADMKIPQVNRKGVQGSAPGGGLGERSTPEKFEILGSKRLSEKESEQRK